MTWCKETFGVEKPIIALLHINAFPGSPLFVDGVDSMEKCVEDARKDLHALQDGGVDAVLFSNEFCLPYASNVEHVESAAMARVIGELKSEITVPFGIDLESDPIAAMDLAAAVSADFVRGTFTGTYAGVGGIAQPDVAAILRRKHALGLKNLRMLYFLNNESDAYIVPCDYVDVANAMIFDAHPDALCVTGAHAGVEAKSTLIEQVRAGVEDKNCVVFAATGCKINNIKEKLDLCDGATVGTTFKVDGKFVNHIDQKRVEEFMANVREYRQEHNI